MLRATRHRLSRSFKACSDRGQEKVRRVAYAAGCPIRQSSPDHRQPARAQVNPAAESLHLGDLPAFPVFRHCCHQVRCFRVLRLDPDGQNFRASSVGPNQTDACFHGRGGGSIFSRSRIRIRSVSPGMYPRLFSRITRPVVSTNSAGFEPGSIAPSDGRGSDRRGGRLSPGLAAGARRQGVLAGDRGDGVILPRNAGSGPPLRWCRIQPGGLVSPAAGALCGRDLAPVPVRVRSRRLAGFYRFVVAPALRAPMYTVLLAAFLLVCLFVFTEAPQRVVSFTIVDRLLLHFVPMAVFVVWLVVHSTARNEASAI